MISKIIVAVVLVTFGTVVIAYSGTAFATPGKAIEFIGLHIQTADRHFIPPIIGALALVGGIALLFVKPKRA